MPAGKSGRAAGGVAVEDGAAVAATGQAPRQMRKVPQPIPVIPFPNSRPAVFVLPEGPRAASPFMLT